MNVWLKGLMTGLILQVAIGQVFFYIINQSLGRSPIYGLASVFATRAIEYNLSKIDMRWFGLGPGTATPLFLGGAVGLTSLIGTYIPQIAVFLGNLLVSVILLIYGFIRFISTIRPSNR